MKKRIPPNQRDTDDQEYNDNSAFKLISIKIYASS